MKIKDNRLIMINDVDKETIDLSSIDQNIDTIETGCFSHLEHVKNIILPQTIKKIENASFIDLPNLENVIYCNDSFFDDRCFINCPKLNKKSLENFSEVSIQQLQENSFFIPDYQRGYKWGNEEVENLLNDLYKSVKEDEPYALQPLVVKEMVDNDKSKIRFCFDYSQFCNSTFNDHFVEVIDGQQRLTTLNLILSFIGKNYCNVDSNFFNIYYQSKRYSDEFFIKAAKETIKKWFKANDLMRKNETSSKEQKSKVIIFQQYIKNKVFFFYYKLSSKSKESSYELFENINKSIRLTNAELFKAFLLNTDNLSIKAESDIKKIAMEWDSIEHRMNDEEFWAFISNEDYDSKTPIDLLLDVFALYIEKTEKIYIKTKKIDPLYSFEILRAYFNCKCTDKKNEIKYINTIKEVWDDGITKVFDFFMRIYNDYFLYHYIGFLRHSELYKNKLNLAELFIDYKDEKTSFIKFKKNIFEKVKTIFQDIDLESINYIRDKMIIRDVFLYYNIWETMKNKRLSIRFPFFAHKNTFIMTKQGTKSVTWQIEHINPRSVEKIDFSIGVNDIAKAYLGNECTITDKQIFETKMSELKEEQTAHFNSIYNLCLLDSYTNEKYQDSPFNIKKAFIVRFDSSSTYIPISTKQIFLKAIDDTNIPVDDLFNKQPNNYCNKNIWTIEEQELYMSQLKKCFQFENEILED